MQDINWEVAVSYSCTDLVKRIDGCARATAYGKQLTFVGECLSVDVTSACNTVLCAKTIKLFGYMQFKTSLKYFRKRNSGMSFNINVKQYTNLSNKYKLMLHFHIWFARRCSAKQINPKL